MKKVCLLLAVILCVAACNLTRDDIGMVRYAPDDGYQARKAKLVVPPDYDIRP